MELWIRSQEGTLGKVLFIRPAGLALDIHFVGNYTTSEHFEREERALEVLDEISNKIKNQYIVKANCLIKPSDMMKEKEYLENTYDGDFIMQPPAYEIEPINPNVIYYEMPKE